MQSPYDVLIKRVRKLRANLRHYMLLKLADGSSVVLNAKIENGTLVARGNKFLIANVSINNAPRSAVECKL